MSRRTKKRNKPYTGKDAKVQAPTVHRYHAEVRGPIKEWWHDHKRIVKWSAIIGGGAVVAVWLIVEAVHLVF
jgi:hypothetical protein